ncbi:hypothetical protein RV01_GL001434 [Enterococcus dispar]|nr:hypothetical protein RV01_GL001434 [Enterococcus dispar]
MIESYLRAFQFVFLSYFVTEKQIGGDAVKVTSFGHEK